MEPNWQYRIDGYGSIVTVKQNIDSTVSSVYVDLDCYAVDEITEAKFDSLSDAEQKHYEWVGEDEPQFARYGQGSRAKFKFSVEDHVATFEGVKPKDWDSDGYNFPHWVRMIDPATRLVENVPGVSEVKPILPMLEDEIENGQSASILGIEDE